jgi:hypothetical protein
LAGTPLGLLLSLIGLLVDRNKKPAIAGLLLVGSVILLFFLASLRR